MGLVDVFVAYQLIKFMTLDYKEFDAYKEGVIDENGKILIKNPANRTSKQKKALAYMTQERRSHIARRRHNSRHPTNPTSNAKPHRRMPHSH